MMIASNNELKENSRRRAARFGTGDALALSSSTLQEPTHLDVHVIHPQTAQLLNSWHHIFVYLQDAVSAQSSNSIVNLAGLIEQQSGRYLSELGAFREKLESTQDSNDPESSYFISSLKIAESLWLLYHVMFVLHHESVVRQLLTWFQLHLENCVPDQAPLEFWPMLHQLVLRGQVDAALQHIEKGDSPAEVEAVKVELSSLLKSIPTLTSHDMSTLQFEEYFSEYHKRCKSFCSLSTVQECPQLKTLGLLLLGDAATIQELASNWLDLFMAVILYKIPCCNKTDIRDAVSECQAVCSNDNALDGAYYDCISLALELDAPMALMRSYQTLQLWWFSAHLCDVLFQSIVLSSKRALSRTSWSVSTAPRFVETLPGSDGMSLRTRLLFIYGSALVKHGAFWNLSATYLGCCGGRGLEVMAANLPMHSYSSEWDAMKVLDVCSQYGLLDTYHAVCGILAKRAFSKGVFGGALAWYLRANDMTNVNRVCERLVEQYLDAESPKLPPFNYLELRDMFNAGDVPSSLESLCILSETANLPMKNDRFQSLLRLADSPRCPPRIADFAVRSASKILEENRGSLTMDLDSLSLLQVLLVKQSILEGRPADASYISPELRRNVLQDVVHAIAAAK